MSTDSTVTEVFEDVEADPDAILEACGAETPAELVESGGKHDPEPDEISDATAAELFADLGDETTDWSREAAFESEFAGDADATVRDDGDAIDATAAELDALTATASTPDRATATDDSVESLESTDSDSSDDASFETLVLRDGGTDELELVGDPTTTRVADDAFGTAGSDAY
ncbi:hypothetical protein [Natrinema salsiterrestre]|uniref:Uncharacterized protein n=1 Tax=Natrinema salsiterrestre TaxID=2950540 RepID=A0A9Q4L5P8_9EURY|nr:hypothetical protein [Natrinema salsiterrestre]MDF9747373.1 hypothetical protein [Natrinema salsiterrestre]